tara:strand:+ start:137 stop:874 length:738 start_codon:yes stop_codon:yes gene_type:complete
MKIDTVILSSNENRDYLDFWPIVSEAWSNFGIEPFLIYTGEEDINLSGNIIKIYSKKINSAFLAQNIRLFYPGILENRTCIISDIDNLPLSKEYFVNSVSDINDQAFIIFRPDACPPNMISIMWNAAKSETWREIFEVSNEGQAMKILQKWSSKRYEIRGKHWYTDQIQLRNYINKFSVLNKQRIVELNDVECGFNRFDRASLEVNTTELLKENVSFSDFHMPRPFLKNKDLIEKVYKHCHNLNQ